MLGKLLPFITWGRTEFQSLAICCASTPIYLLSALNLPPSNLFHLMPLRLWLGRDNEQLICICHATLHFADLYHSLPRMSFPGWKVLAVSCLRTFLSLWSSLSLFSESFCILPYPLWEGGSELHNIEEVGRLHAAVWWWADLAAPHVWVHWVTGYRALGTPLVNFFAVKVSF